MPPWICVERLAAQQAKRTISVISETLSSSGRLFSKRKRLMGAAAEDVSGTGGIYDMDALWRFDSNRTIAIDGVTAFRTKRGIDKGNVVFAEQLRAAFFRRDAPKKVDLFVADFDNICLRKTPIQSDGVPRFRLTTEACRDWDQG